LVDKALILRKIERVETYLKQIIQKKDPGIEKFERDKDLQSIILFNRQAGMTATGTEFAMQAWR